jgi:hypothetical protein
MDNELIGHLEQIMGARPVRWRPVAGRTRAGRWVVECENGSSAFVKAATDAHTASWLRTEEQIYRHVTGTFMPAFLGWLDGERPILVIEDLSRAHWPPPWTEAMVEAVRVSLAAVRSSPLPPGLPALEAEREMLTSWRRVAAAPEELLALGLCTSGWLEAALPALLAAEASAVLDGPDLLHLDVRSDNLCLLGPRAVLVDWNWACRGNGLVDIAGWVPSLHAEGGPLPETVLPDQPELAALLSGYWAWNAGKPPGDLGELVRQVQFKQLRSALPWAARALGLPPPDGPGR